MGLDMYLTAKRFLAYERDDELRRRIEKVPGLDTKGHPVKYVDVKAGYWRKANAIHNWFVQNVQDGEDNCQTVDVSRTQLTTLRDTCQKVADNHELASELLPPVSGFFFGDTDIDEWYFKDVEFTIDVIDKALTLGEEWWFQYHSSW
jgi:hypothetical protein